MKQQDEGEGEGGEMQRFDKKQSSSLLRPLLVNPPHMVFHIVHPAEHPTTPLPLALDLRIVLGLVPSPVLLAREPPLRRLRTALVAAEEVLVVPVEVLAQVAGAREYRPRRTPDVRAAPGPVCVSDPVVCQISCVRGF